MGLYGKKDEQCEWLLCRVTRLQCRAWAQDGEVVVGARITTTQVTTWLQRQRRGNRTAWGVAWLCEGTWGGWRGLRCEEERLTGPSVDEPGGGKEGRAGPGGKGRKGKEKNG